ncbi:hypothetical protein GEMRC1_010260 [Eukaryota sp. GEM-RC1]
MISVAEIVNQPKQEHQNMAPTILEPPKNLLEPDPWYITSLEYVDSPPRLHTPNHSPIMPHIPQGLHIPITYSSPMHIQPRPSVLTSSGVPTVSPCDTDSVTIRSPLWYPQGFQDISTIQQVQS